MSESIASGVAYGRIETTGSDRFQTLRRELGVTTFGLNLIRLAPGQRGRIHRHERQEELYVVLEGTLTLVLDGEERDLAAHEVVRVGPDVRRQLVNRGPGPLALLAIGGAEPHAGRDGQAYASWEDSEPSPPQELPLPADLPPGELRTAP
jgi:uncharacterized cupin superfamily protein